MIEVRELIIRARLDDSDRYRKGGGENETPGVPQQGLSDRDIQKIIAQCAEEVMRILNRKKER